MALRMAESIEREHSGSRHRSLPDACIMTNARPRSLLALLVAASTFGAGAVAAQPAAKSETENLVPPGGAAFDVPVHAGEVCILSFPGERLVGSALASSGDFEVKAWGNDGVAV